MSKPVKSLQIYRIRFINGYKFWSLSVRKYSVGKKIVILYSMFHDEKDLQVNNVWVCLYFQLIKHPVI